MEKLLTSQESTLPLCTTLVLFRFSDCPMSPMEKTAQRRSRMVSEGGESGEGSGASTAQDSQPDTVSETVPWQTIAPIDM